MREARIFRRRRYHTDPWFKVGIMPLPFTKERRLFVYIGAFGFEVWLGSTALREGIFEKR